jgi:hypothetical protein
MARRRRRAPRRPASCRGATRRAPDPGPHQQTWRPRRLLPTIAASAGGALYAITVVLGVDPPRWTVLGWVGMAVAGWWQAQAKDRIIASLLAALGDD